MATATMSEVDAATVAAAESLDRDIRREWSASELSLAKVGVMLNKMREDRLWRFLKNGQTNENYRRFDEYVSAVIGMASTPLYDRLAIHAMMEGPEAVSQKDIDEMGVKKAAEVARLDASDRTPDVVEAAKKESLSAVKRLVREKLNEKLPPEERKDPTFMFARNLDQPTIELIELVEEDGVWIEAVRNGDKSVSQLVKLWNYVWARFVLEHREELDEGHAYRMAMEAAKEREIEDAPADDEDTRPPEPGDHEARIQAMGAE